MLFCVEAIVFWLRLMYDYVQKEVIMATVNVTIRLDAEVKQQAEELFGRLGMDLSTAMNVFIKQALEYGGIPFKIRTKRPNKTTLAAMAEARALMHDPNAKRVNSVEELMAELNK